MGDVEKPGVQAIVNRLKAQGDLITEGFVDTCLDLMGPLEVNQETRQELIDHASIGGNLTWGNSQETNTSKDRISEMLQLIVSLRDYQYA